MCFEVSYFPTETTSLYATPIMDTGTRRMLQMVVWLMRKEAARRLAETLFLINLLCIVVSLGGKDLAGRTQKEPRLVGLVTPLGIYGFVCGMIPPFCVWECVREAGLTAVTFSPRLLLNHHIIYGSMGKQSHL